MLDGTHEQLDQVMRARPDGLDLSIGFIVRSIGVSVLRPVSADEVLVRDGRVGLHGKEELACVVGVGFGE